MPSPYASSISHHEHKAPKISIWSVGGWVPLMVVQEMVWNGKKEVTSGSASIWILYSVKGGKC